MVTTDASCGAVNAMHDSFTALGGLVPMFNIQLGEIVVGGVGSGIYGFLLFAILAVFVAGLMVGRTPEYVGKKIEGREVKLAVLAIAVLPLSDPRLHRARVGGARRASPGRSTRGRTASRRSSTPSPRRSGTTARPLPASPRARPSTTACSGVAMWIGRFFMIVPMLAIAGSLAAKKYTPETAGSFPTTGPLWVGLLVGIDPDPRRPHLPAQPRARPHRRSSRDDRRPSLLIGNATMARTATQSLFTAELIAPAIGDAFRKLDPRQLIRNPVMFVTASVAALLTVLLVLGHDTLGVGFKGQLVVWLWLTVLFGTFAEALAEGRGKAQAASLRATKADLTAKRVNGTKLQMISASELRAGDIVLVETGDLIPADGEVVEGVASVNEAAITGESAPVIREAGGDRSAVTAGTRVISDQIKVRITVNPGQGFLDRMIALVEGAERQKTPNEIALTILLVGLTIIFLIAVGDDPRLRQLRRRRRSRWSMLAALLITLIPTTIAALLSAIGIAGMDRLVRFNVLAKSGRAVEAAGDVDTLLLDKTGTITIGDRQASEFRPVSGVNVSELAEAALLASLADETPEGRSIVILARERFDVKHDALPHGAEVIPFTAQTRISGVRIGSALIQKGAVDSVLKANPGTGETPAAAELRRATDEIARAGMTPLAVAKDGRILGAVALKDVVKAGIRERFGELRRMGIRTVMITGDNPLTAAAIAAEAGVDDFLAQATPEDKLALIRSEQQGGKLVAMCGDGTNDAPALAQADVGVAMNTGTQAAREAGNMVDLDSDPTKLIEIVGLGKQLLMTRGSLTTFSVANDIAKYFAIIPAMFVVLYPGLAVLNIMRLATPQSAILSAIIFNALIIPALVPLALKGVKYRPIGAGPLLRRNLAIYGLGGVIVPFIGIKAIDVLVNTIGLA